MTGERNHSFTACEIWELIQPLKEGGRKKKAAFMQDGG